MMRATAAVRMMPIFFRVFIEMNPPTTRTMRATPAAMAMSPTVRQCILGEI